jgi:hypothetical protein
VGERAPSDVEPGSSGRRRFGSSSPGKGGADERSGGKFGRPSAGKPRGFGSRPGFPKRPGSSGIQGGKAGFRDRKFGKKKPEA